MGTDETQPEAQPATPAPEQTPENVPPTTPDPTGPPASPQPAQEPPSEQPVAPDAPAAPAGTEPQQTPPESQEQPLAARVSGTPPAGDTPSTQRAAAPSTPGGEFPAVASPVRVDSKSARDDNDALEGQFCEVVSGPHQGRRGLFESVANYDPQTGYPTQIVVRTRDAQNELLSVDYADVRPAAEYSGGR